jgi:hypothetical protein
MQTAFIKFASQEDRASGFYELATHSHLSSFPGEVYQVPIEALRLLDDKRVAYRRATQPEVRAALNRMRRSDG